MDQFLFYPNPFFDFISVKYSGMLDESVALKVFNLEGELILDISQVKLGKQIFS